MKLKKILIVAFVAFVLSLTGCLSKKETSFPQLEEMKSGEEIAIITTNKGIVKVRFFPKYAPKAVENFTTHSKNGYYDGLTFHRVINDFVVQGGDPSGDGSGGESIWGKPFELELTPSLRHISGAVAMANSGPNTNGSQFYIVENDKLDEQTTTAFKDMEKKFDSEVGKTNDGKIITVKDILPKPIMEKYISDGGTPNLDQGIISKIISPDMEPTAGYTIFGQVIEGMGTVHAIADIKTENDNPVEDVIIEKIEIVAYEK